MQHRLRIAQQAGAMFEQARSLEVRAAGARAFTAVATRDDEQTAKLLALLGLR